MARLGISVLCTLWLTCSLAVNSFGNHWVAFSRSHPPATTATASPIDLRKKLRRALLERSPASTEQSSAAFELPEWPRLVELFRSFLEAPEALATLPLLSKELAFRAALEMGAVKQDADRRLVGLFAANNRARQFIFSAAAYVCAAAGLPRDFSRRLEDEINVLIG